MSFKYQKLLKNPKDCYTVMHLIGTGAFSKVYLGMHKPTQMAVAIKQIDKAALKSDQLNKRVKHEIQILKKLRDCRIVKLLEVLDLPR
jgi:serine/threonine protein kinase